MSFLINPYSFVGGFTPNYANFDLVFSLRDLTNWTNAVIKVERSSDNTQTNIFFDDNGEITLSSLIGSSSSTPDVSETTFGSWAGSDTVKVASWYSQDSSGSIVPSNTLLQATYADMPTIISAGTLETKGGNTVMTFNTSSMSKNGGNHFAELNSGNDYTFFTVAAHDISAGVGTVFSTNTSTGAVDNLRHYADRRTAKRSTILRGSGTNYFADLLAQTDSGDLRLQTFENDGSNKEMTNYLDGTVQNTDTSWAGSYTNSDFTIGVSNTANDTPLVGSIIEILIQQNMDLDEIADYNSDIIDRYSI